MIRRLFRTGNSVVLSLPKEILEGLGLEDGKNVSLELDRRKRQVVLKPAEKHLAIAGVDEEFARQVNDFIEHYRPALEKLAE